MFKLEIKTGGSAFGEDTYEAAYEIRRILNEVTHKLMQGQTEGSVNDINGNKICTFELDM